MSTSDQGKNIGVIIAGLFLAIGLAVGGYFIGQTMFNAKVALNTAEAKGLAEKRVKSDRANWNVQFSVSGKSKEEIPSLYNKAEQNQNEIINILKENGLSDKDIKIGIISYYFSEYRNDNREVVDESHTLSGSINVETSQVDLIETLRSKVNKLITKGIDIQNNPPTYRFTKLNEIKPEMLREATKNARIAASEFAENAGIKVGGIRYARQGSFYITDAGEEYGDTQKIEKDIRVVTTINFYLTD